eukprot:7201586-Pyramimonas_sp.AAC.1
MGSLRWKSQNAQALRDLGARAGKFGLNSGWNFAKEGHHKAFLKKLMEEHPDEVHLSPTCGPWSNMQELNIHWRPCWKEYLAELREWHHRVHLQFVAKVYLIQQQGGRHARIGHPTTSRAWHTEAFSRLHGENNAFEQCMYGYAVDGSTNMFKKPTTIKTTKKLAAAVLNEQCDRS